MTEWLKVLVLKTGICTHIVGSNPTFSNKKQQKVHNISEVFIKFKLSLLKILKGYLVISPIYIQLFLSPLVDVSVIISFLKGGSYEQRIKILETDKNLFLKISIKRQHQIDALLQAAPKDQVHSYYIPEIFKIYVTPSEVVKWVENTIDHPIYYGFILLLF